MTSIRFFSFVITCFFATHAGAEKITVAVASNFTAAMNEIVNAFEQTSGHEVELAFGSSGKFYAQISNGAPFDAFFSADQDKPITLEKDGLAVPGSRFTYAVGTLARWSSKPNLVDDAATVLKQGNVNKLSIANPKLAPYGAAAVQTLESLGLKETTESKWVQGENIAQTHQFVATGNADIGFVALAQVVDQGKFKEGSGWIVPGNLHQPIRQDAVLLVRGKDNPAALALMQFMRGDKATEIIQAFGYGVEKGIEK